MIVIMIFLCMMSSSSGPEIKQKEFIQHLSIAALGEVLGYAWLVKEQSTHSKDF